MSGHSKWANIKNRKGAQDKKRSEAFTKISKNIMTAIRVNGGNTNPLSNTALNEAIEKAKLVNMPKDNIDRLLKRFEERKNNLETYLYEGFAFGGVPILVEVETDNKNRTLSEIKFLFKEHEASLGSEGSVVFLFDRVGEIQLSKAVAEDRQLELIDIGAVGFEDNNIYTEVSKISQIINKIKEWGQTIEQSRPVWKCRQPILLKSEEEVVKVMDLIDELNDRDDVIDVYSGFDYQNV